VLSLFNAFFVIFGAYIIIFGPLFIMIVTSLLKEFGEGLGKTGKPQNAILPFLASLCLFQRGKWRAF